LDAFIDGRAAPSARRCREMLTTNANQILRMASRYASRQRARPNSKCGEEPSEVSV
jgi:hypothetical protein